MRYVSTRGLTPAVGFSQAVASGLAPDGGLFVPQSLPDLSGELKAFRGLSYAQLCARFLAPFADFGEDELLGLAHGAYANFDTDEVVPLRELGPNVKLLELFHGPTLAFKDLALQLLGPLYGRQCALRGESINVLGATSGDTGAAAIHGLLGRSGIAIFILYPDGRVSALQERQMACTGAPNVHALAVAGTFDDAQRILKEAFGDEPFRKAHRLSAVNSINIARILAQCVYYLHAWLRLPEEWQERARFIVPTGNFGNVLSGWILRRMGVPIRGFRVATNRNDILHRFFASGDYRVGTVSPSLAPSMDIQVASNFERFAYYQAGEDPGKVRDIMAQISATGGYSFGSWDSRESAFTSSSCTDGEIRGIIRSVHERTGAIIDPHTACGFKDLDPTEPSVVLATAHPAKFPETIREAIGIEPTHPSLEALKTRPLVRHKIGADVAPLRAFIEDHAV